MSIEKALKSYLKCTGRKVKEKEFFEYAEGNGDAAFNVLFVLAEEEIETITESKALDRVVEVLRLGELIINNIEGIDRSALSRKVVRLQQKLDRILIEQKKKFSNINKIKSEFGKVNRELDKLLNLLEEKDTKQYDFMEFLVDETRNITYLEYTLKKMPRLANVRDKDETLIFQHIIDRYLDSIEDGIEEDILYYENLVSLLLSQKSFRLSNNEKRDCLDTIYKYLNCGKKWKRRQKEKVAKINLLVDRLKGVTETKKTVEDMAGKYNIHVFFIQPLKDQIKLLSNPHNGTITDRKEVTDYVLSMDDPDAVEIDDALSCRILPNGNFLLGVHIASVLGYFPYESDIVQEALYRSQSIYLPHEYQAKENDFRRVIPIFPYDFAANKASLKENEKRLTRSYYFEITPTGEVVNEKFLKTITTNNKRTTYREADKMIEKGFDNSDFGRTLKNLYDLSLVLSANFKGTELYEKIKESTRDNSELRVKRTGSENIVFQTMLLTGTRVARYFAEHNYPFPYRVLEINEDNNIKLQAMIDNLTETYGGEQFKNLYQLISGIYPKASYAMEGGHSGLGEEHYGHCTSELRRGADILVEHALEVCFDKEPTPKELERLRSEIESKVNLINSRQAPIDYFVKEYQKKYRRR